MKENILITNDLIPPVVVKSDYKDFKNADNVLANLLFVCDCPL